MALLGCPGQLLGSFGQFLVRANGRQSPDITPPNARHFYKLSIRGRSRVSFDLDVSKNFSLKDGGETREIMGSHASLSPTEKLKFGTETAGWLAERRWG